MGDSDSAAMASQFEEEEVDVMELVRRLQAARDGGGGGGGEAAAAATPAAGGGGATKRGGDSGGFMSLIRNVSTKVSVDEEAKKGQFGWFEVMGVQMPYILRSGTSYIPIKVIERSVFGCLLGEVPKEAVESCRVDAVLLTEAEAKLLNEVNMKHCVGAYGKEAFSQRDKMVGKEEFEKFVTFLIFCRKCVVLGETPEEGARCGVVKVQGDGETSLLPYTLLGGAKWVPLAYFEGEVGDLRSGAKTVRGWDVSYLRLASRIASPDPGAKDRLAGPSAQVIRLDTVLSCYPSKPRVSEDWQPKALMARAASSVTAVWTLMCQTGPRRKYAGKLTLIKEFPTGEGGPAYKFLPTALEGAKLMGVNCKPRAWHDLLVGLPDLVATIPGLEVAVAGAELAERGANLFRGNEGQSAVLEKEGKAAQWDPVPLVRLGDAKKHLAMLKTKVPVVKKRRFEDDSESDSD